MCTYIRTHTKRRASLPIGPAPGGPASTSAAPWRARPTSIRGRAKGVCLIDIIAYYLIVYDIIV